MKRVFWLLIVLLTFQSSPSLAQSTVVDSIISDGVWRPFRVYLPARYKPGSTRPLILHLHAYGSDNFSAQFNENYMRVADTANFLVAYPDATLDPNLRGWNVGWPGIGNAGSDDVKFLSAFIDTLHARYSIDLKRVYASGLSLGGFMCYQLAWKLSNKIAAIASVSGSMYPGQFAMCTPPRAIPVMEIHGTADQIIPFNGTSYDVNTDTILNFWVLNDRCLSLPSVTNLPDVDPNDGSNVVHYVWSAEVQSITCELYKVINGPHIDWPSRHSGSNHDFDASSTIWQFFSRYTLGEFSVVKPPLEMTRAESIVFPNPCTQSIHRSDAYPGGLKIFDALGREVMSSNAREINVAHLPSGFYVVRAELHGLTRTEKLLKK